MMKKMIALFSAALLLGSVSAFAQKVGVEAGFGFSSTNFDYSIGKKNIDMSGLSVGLTYELPIAQTGLGFMPGIFFSYYSKNDVDLNLWDKWQLDGKLSESYVSVPLDLTLRLNMADGVNLVVFAGPTLAMGVTAKLEEAGSGMDYDIYDGALSSFTRYGRFDVLVGGGLALELSDMVRFSAGYDYGLINRNSGSTSGLLRIHRSQFKVGVAYMF